MSGDTTPEWLKETQRRSWEPEILISGITLTFLFIISNYIYNFFGMLIQDFALYEIIAMISYYTSIIILNGLRIILIVHLILRGIWTGLVGLSYVFPDGVKIQKLSKKHKSIKPIKPDIFVIKLENICSLLFSFIFNIITSTLGMFIVFVPIILLFVFGLDLYYIHVFTRHVLVPLVLVLVLLPIVFSKRINKLQIKSRFDNSFIIHTRLIYFSNIGKWKSTLIFTGCVMIVALICRPKLSEFSFGNHKGVEISTSSSLVNMNQNHYENLREQKLRIPKATIDHFRITANSMELFVSFFKEDKYTIKKLKNDPALLKELKIKNSRDKINVIDLYKVVIDNRELSGLRWYHTEKIATSQKGFMTTIPLDTLQPGYHELKIDKLYWSIKKSKMKPIENWEFIVFEKDI